jgi:hypothetical protein
MPLIDHAFAIFPTEQVNTITISLPEDRLEALQKLAERLRVTPEDLVRTSIESLLACPDDEEFRRAVQYVLDKNTELYRRLA